MTLPCTNPDASCAKKLEMNSPTPYPDFDMRGADHSYHCESAMLSRARRIGFTWTIPARGCIVAHFAMWRAQPSYFQSRNQLGSCTKDSNLSHLCDGVHGRLVCATLCATSP